MWSISTQLSADFVWNKLQYFIFLEMSGIKIGARVTVPTKNVGEGTIAFIGETDFAKGEWIGIILDEKKGEK